MSEKTHSPQQAASSPNAAKPQPRPKLNLRRPDIMEQVQEQVERHYYSSLVERLRERGGVVEGGNLTVRLAKQFGFCYGVDRAIDLAYAARKVFANRRIFLLGEIIHNSEVNEQLHAMDIRFLSGHLRNADLVDVSADDIIIVPAFGADVDTMRALENKGCQLVDTTCGDVMSVWKRVRQYAAEGTTSVIHGKKWHEETKATSSHALGNGTGQHLIVFDLSETDFVCNYIVNGGDKQEFLAKFEEAHSPGFDPDRDLMRIGVANQTTMLRGETEEVQRRLRQAVIDRYGIEKLGDHFRAFDTVCGATQERQDALADLLQQPLDLVIVIGGYNSSNTSHLAEMASGRFPTYFIRNARNIISSAEIRHFDLRRKQEILTSDWLPTGKAVVGVTAGASCPNSVIEDTIARLFELRGIRLDDLLSTTSG